MNQDLPCPFCGEPDPALDDIHDADVGEHHWFITCDGCGAQGPVARTTEEAAALWNRQNQLT